MQAILLFILYIFVYKLSGVNHRGFLHGLVPKKQNIFCILLCEIQELIFLVYCSVHILLCARDNVQYNDLSILDACVSVQITLPSSTPVSCAFVYIAQPSGKYSLYVSVFTLCTQAVKVLVV